MIIDPDFLDHWRTTMLIDALGGDQMAPLYVIRIWAHCQSRKATIFSMPANGLKALCRYAGDSSKLESALVDSGFILRDDASITIIGWAEHNAKLISNWKNGATGGRPPRTKQEPTNNPNETQQEPTVTQAEPIRLDKIREEIKPTNPNGLDVASNIAADLAQQSRPAIEQATEDTAKGKHDCPHQKIIDLYHEVLPMCPRVRDWTPARATQLRARWNEDKSRQNLDYWKRFFEYVATCDFLVGKAIGTPFFVDLEWLTKSGNFTKVREAKYENRRSA